MNLNFLPSLQHLTLAKIAIALCNNYEIKALLEESKISNSCKSLGVSCTVEDSCFSVLGRSKLPLRANDEHSAPRHDVIDDLLKQIQGRMSGIISGLNIGKSLERKILSFIPHVVLEIKKWQEENSKVLPNGYDAQVYFCWKSVGTIDLENTAENLLNHGNLSVRNRSPLESLYCKQNPFTSLRNSNYDKYKSHLISKCHSIDYWTAHLDGLHVDGLHDRSSVFPDALYITNVSTLQYFYRKCQEDQKQAFLNDVLSKHWNNLDFVRFCVSKLCQNGYEELSSLQCYTILRCFLNWPLQSFFLDMSECLLVNLGLVGMNNLLHDILRIINTLPYEDIDYMNLLKEFWKRIPSCHKDSLMNSSEFRRLKIALKQIFAKSLTPELNHQYRKK